MSKMCGMLSFVTTPLQHGLINLFRFTLVVLLHGKVGKQDCAVSKQLLDFFPING